MVHKMKQNGRLVFLTVSHDCRVTFKHNGMYMKFIFSDMQTVPQPKRKSLAVGIACTLYQ